jgi:hypothetical protein
MNTFIVKLVMERPKQIQHILMLISILVDSANQGED